MRNIVFLGLVSFFTDISSHMIYPLIPLYLVASFGATPIIVGIIEGIAESVASLLKVYSGYLTDKFQRKKLIAFSGYATNLFYMVMLLVSTSWAGVLFARVVERFGKGVRTAPRDVLISESAVKGKMGQAFGLHKAIDLAGSAVGALLTFFIMKNMSDGENFHSIFVVALIPALLGLFMFVFIKEKKRTNSNLLITKEPFWKNIKKIDGQLKFYLFIVFIFMLGNSSNAFFVLKAQSLGFKDENIVLLFFLIHFTATLLATPAGYLSDKIGRKKLLIPGYLIFSLCYMGFAFVSNGTLLIGVFIMFGFYTALIAGVERAFIAEIAPPHLKGTMLGLHGTVVGVALLPASLITGFLWTVFGNQVPFMFGSFMAFTAALLLFFFMKGQKRGVN